MCGIFGYVGAPSKDNNKILHKFIYHLAYESETRGTHSTGFASRYDSGLVIADKLPYRGSTFCNMSGKFKSLRRKMPSTFIGHTRYGTGSNPRINNNNHPFFGDNFHMVHNGIIPSWRDIAKRENVLDEMMSETDSEVVLRILEKRMAKDKRGIIPFKEHIEWVLGHVWGNMAIALLDLNAPHVWLFRNDNPINFFCVPENVFGAEINFFCSTKKIFEAAWKSCFKRKLDKDVTASRFLSSNQLFRLSTTTTIVGTEPKKFLWYPIQVSRPFHKVNQYYGGYMGGATTSTYKVNQPITEFYSSVVDPTMPELGCRFKKQEMKKLRSALSGSGDTENVQVDGMTVSEFTALNATWRALRDVGNTSMLSKKVK